MKSFQLTIAKLGENLFDGEALSVTLPGVDGQFTVLAHHEPFVSTLKAGELSVTAASGEKHKIRLESGVAEIANNRATVLL